MEGGGGGGGMGRSQNGAHAHEEEFEERLLEAREKKIICCFMLLSY